MYNITTANGRESHTESALINVYTDQETQGVWGCVVQANCQGPVRPSSECFRVQMWLAVPNRLALYLYSPSAILPRRARSSKNRCYWQYTIDSTLFIYVRDEPFGPVDLLVESFGKIYHVSKPFIDSIIACNKRTQSIKTVS